MRKIYRCRLYQCGYYINDSCAPPVAALASPTHASCGPSHGEPETIYPDISDILQRKAEGRRDLARRSFGEKIAAMEALRERLAPFKRLREQRRATKLAAPPSGDAS